MFTVKNSLVAAVLLSFALPSFAINLDEAKAAGYVSEQANGYVAVISDKAPADVRALVDSINSKRSDVYKGIAEKNGISVQNVENMAGERLAK